MIRLSTVLLLLVAGGCADKSRGAALNECRMKYDIRSSAEQSRLIPDCMQAKSFELALACAPITDDHEWDWRVNTFAYDNQLCYRPVGSERWIATTLSPM